MSSITSLCWACQSIDENQQRTCLICSTPSPPPKAAIPKPRNARRPQRLPSISAPSLLRLYKMYNYKAASISRAFEDICAMGGRAPTPERKVHAIFLLSHALPQAIPNISLTAPDGAYSTMDFDTFNVLSSGVQDRDTLRVLISPNITVWRHKRGHNCERCCEAAWANAYFAEAMREKSLVQSDGKKCSSMTDLNTNGNEK
jgi:hypothetical protein